MNDQVNRPERATRPEATRATFGLSDPGRVRENNQDQYLIARLQNSMWVDASTLLVEPRLFGQIQGEILLVADGMGGHAAGDRASRLAIGHLIRCLLDDPPALSNGADGGGADLVAKLRQMLIATHQKLLEVSSQHSTQRGMGTTLTMALVVESNLHLVHVGDSRCYLVRDGVAEQLTTDHTLARQMVETGGMKPEEESGSRWSNVLWNVLGGLRNGDLTVEVRTVPLEAGDVVVLCTDGLHRYVDHRHLAAIVSSIDSAERACRRLVTLANESGGEDNVTVVVSRPNGQRSSGGRDDFDTVVP